LGGFFASWQSARLTARLKGAGQVLSVVKIKDGLRYHHQGANATDKKVVSFTKRNLMISATTLHTANLEENAINATAAGSQIFLF
jgi:hypothetical protein